MRRQHSPFVETATRLVQSSLSLVKGANEELQKLLQYPLTSTLATEEVSEVLEDNFKEVRNVRILMPIMQCSLAHLQSDHSSFTFWLTGNVTTDSHSYCQSTRIRGA